MREIGFAKYLYKLCPAFLMTTQREMYKRIIYIFGIMYVKKHI